MSEITHFVDNVVRHRVTQRIKNAIHELIISYNHSNTKCENNNNDNSIDDVCFLIARKIETALFVIGLQQSDNYINKYGQLIYNLSRNVTISVGQDCDATKENILSKKDTRKPKHCSEICFHFSNKTKTKTWCSSDTTYNLNNTLLYWNTSDYDASSSMIKKQIKIKEDELTRAQLITVLTRDEILTSNIESGCADTSSIIRCYKCKSYDEFE